MKLKTLEISGFKSFADKTTIEFMPGMTGIVGPNGSGKSNIIEAMRWVMGETSAKDLRGSKMSDVIFAGTGTRGALSRAEVSMTFDNSDKYINSEFTEIRITRKLYRSGESSYQINGVESRLRDIHELFMDTGLGRESFSIISQGRVEGIFNAKPEERRAIIEEVAGVYQYKQHKEQAKKELQATDDNLARVADIIYELDQRLEPLALQSAQAQDYLAQKTRFDELNVLYLAGQHAQLATDKGSLDASLTAQATELAMVSQTLNALNADVQCAQTQLSEAQAKRERLQAKLVDLTGLQERLSGQQQLDAAQAQHLATQVAQIQTQLATLATQITAQNAVVTEKQASLTVAQTAFDKLDAQLQAVTGDDLDRQQTALQAALTQERDAYVDWLQAEAQHQNDVTSTQRLLAQNSAQITHLTQRQSEQATLVQEAQSAVTTAQSAIDATNYGALETQLAEKNAAIQTAHADYEALQKQWYDQLAVANKLESRLNAMQAVDDYAGFYQGVRHLMGKKAAFPGLIGVVAELIKVPAAYTLAVETALGAALQQVVTQNTATAKQAVAYLTKQRAGRVTFLPLDVIKPRQIDAQVRASAEKIVGFVGVAADLVEMAGDLSAIKASLLGTTLVAQDLNAATNLAKAVNYRVRVVSLDGQIVNAGGAITGGAHKNTSSLLSRQQEVEQLQNDLAREKQTATQLEQALQSQQALGQRLVREQNRLRDELQTLSDGQQNLILAVREAEQNLASAQRQLQVVQLDLQAAQAQTAELTATLTKAQADLAEAQAQRAATQQAQIDYQQQLDQLAQKQQASASESADIKAQHASAQAALAYEQAALQREKQQLADLTAQEATLAVQLADLTTRQTQVDEATLAADLTKVQSELRAVQSDLSAVTTVVTDLQSDLTVYEKRLENLRQQQSQLLTTKSDLTAQQARLQAQMEQVETQLLADYELIPAAVALPQNFDLGDLRTQIKLLERGLAELGDVNIGAIQEYEDVKTRYDFLTQQRADLQAAQQNLLGTIDEMDTEVKARFKATFDAVASHFGAIFTQMFGGGRSEIRLTDPENLLTTGIDITAQPPGKKFQQMSLLSGGEKALTAITLLFAILQVRPVPFVVLDEAEAALDEANVDRFANYLHDFSGTTQFIVITHRKGTMTNANLLYGVTQQDAGVSKMVAVSLDKIAD